MATKRTSKTPARRARSGAASSSATAAPAVNPILESARLKRFREQTLTAEETAALEAARPGIIEAWPDDAKCVAADMGHDACRCVVCEAARRLPG